MYAVPNLEILLRSLPNKSREQSGCARLTLLRSVEIKQYPILEAGKIVGQLVAIKALL